MVNSSEKKSSEAIPFEFKNNFSLDERQEQIFVQLYHLYAKQVSESLSAFSDLSIETKLIGVEQVPFSQYIRSLLNPTCIATLDMQPLSGCGFFEINSSIAYIITNKMLGGDLDVLTHAHGMSNLEMAINRKLINLLLKQLSFAWKPILEVSFFINKIYAEPHSARVIPAFEPCLVSRIEIKIHHIKGLLTIAIPILSLSSLINKIELSQLLGPAPAPSSSFAEINLESLPVELTARIGHIELSKKDLENLQIGDIIPLDHNAADLIPIFIDDEKIFEGKPGLIGKNKAIKVCS